jgi:hypothetical protein
VEAVEKLSLAPRLEEASNSRTASTNTIFQQMLVPKMIRLKILGYKLLFGTVSKSAVFTQYTVKRL